MLGPTMPDLVEQVRVFAVRHRPAEHRIEPTMEVPGVLCDGSGDLVAATQVSGHGSGVPR